MKSILISQAHPDSSYNHFAHALSGICATVAHDAVMTPADGEFSVSPSPFPLFLMLKSRLDCSFSKFFANIAVLHEIPDLGIYASIQINGVQYR